MSKRSSRQKRLANEVDQLKLQNSLSSSISKNTITHSNSVLVKSPGALVERLLKLQVELVSRINVLKTQKIAALEAYNREYDQFSILSLSLNSNDPNKLNHTESHSSEPYEKDNNEVQEQLRVEERQLKNVLTEVYELKNNNNMQESLLTCQQLQQLSHLLKRKKHLSAYHSRSFGIPQLEQNLRNQKQNQLKKEEQTIIKQITQTRSHQSSLSNQTSIIASVEEIEMLKQVMEKLMSRKLSYLKTHKQLVTRYQSQSSSKVRETLNKKLFLEKELENLNQTFNYLSNSYRIQTQPQSTPSIPTYKIGSISNKTNKPQSWLITPGKSFSVEKWQKILKYQRLKKKLEELENQLDSNHQINDFALSDADDKKNKSRTTYTEQRRKELLQQNQNSKSINKGLKARIKMYEKFLEEESQNKHELYGQIKRKKVQYDQLKKQNQLMNQIILNSNL